MQLNTIIGLSAGFLTTISLLPQLIKLYKTKLTRDISIYWTLLLTIGIVLWLIYGIILRDVPLIFANATGGLFSVLILIGKLLYRKYE